MNSRLNKWSLPLGRLRMRDSLLALVLTGITISAHAGGLEAGRRGLSTLQVWLYSCAAVLAACYLIKEGVQCFKAGGDWVHEFGTSCVKVFFCGGAVVLAGWLFSAGGS